MLPITESIVNAMTTRIVNRLSPRKIILFGSYAKGIINKNSDVDLLVVMDCTSEKKRELQAEIRRELREFNVPKDIVVATEDDLERYKNSWWTIYYSAVKEGRVVFEH